MKRGKKLLLMLTVLVVLALCVWAVVSLVPKEAAEAGEAAEEPEKTLFSLDPAAVQSLSWTYNGETMEFVRSGEAWIYTADADFPTNLSALNKMVETLSEIKEEGFVGVQEDLDQYGLADTAVVVQVTTDRTDTILFGNNVNYGSSSYMLLEDGNIYLVDLTVPRGFRKALSDVVEVEKLPDLTGTALAGANLSLASCVAYIMEDSELEPFGLNAPQKLSVTCKDGTELNLEFAMGADTYYYLRLSGSKMVYEITSAAYTKLAELVESE